VAERQRHLDQLADGLSVAPVPQAVLVKAESVDLRARRDRALATVGLTQAELRARVVDYSRGELTPDERDAWYEVDVCNFLLGEDGL